VEQGFFIVLAQCGTNAHVSNDSAGNTRRKPLRRSVAARTVLLEDALAVVLRLTGLSPNRVFVCFGFWLSIFLCGKRKCWNRSQGQNT